MFFDLNVPVSPQNAKGPQISTIEAQVDILIHCQSQQSSLFNNNLAEQSQVGYSVIAFSQTVLKKVDPKNHSNFLDGLLNQLRPRPGILYLKRLNIVLDQDSEKGFGLVGLDIHFLANIASQFY